MAELAGLRAADLLFAVVVAGLATIVLAFLAGGSRQRRGPAIPSVKLRASLN